MKKFYILSVAFLFIIPIAHSYAQEIDILWSADTYVSPFYKGRTLWSRQSRINFLAIPRGLGNPASLNYRWTQNGTVLGNISGVGKNTLSFFDTGISRPQTIKVDILTNDNDRIVRASASTVVVPITPTLSVYENNPLYGFMLHREVGGVYGLKEREITFTAFPFFFSAVNRMDQGLGYEWRTNAGGVETANSVTYRTPDDTAGVAEVNVRVSNMNKILQDANKSFLVQFENLTDI